MLKVELKLKFQLSKEIKSMSQAFWKFWAWISIACGLLAYLTGWYALLTKTNVLGVSTEFYFYDSIAAGIFGFFFLIYSIHYGKKQ